MKTEPASRQRWIPGAGLMLLAPALGCGLAMALNYQFPWGLRLAGGLWLSPSQLSWSALACGAAIAMVGVALLPARRFQRAVIALLWLSALVVLMPLGSWIITCHLLRWCEPSPLTADGLPVNPLEVPPP